MSKHNVILDFDDFGESVNSLDLLFRMRAHWPQFKVTLFTVPMHCSKEFLRAVKEIPWIQLAIHGWEHKPVECEEWSALNAKAHVVNALEWGVFVRGFKAPQWRLGPGILEALKEQGDFWVADNADPASNPFGHDKPKELMYYYANGKDLIPGTFSNDYDREHGHINCLDAHNDIRQMFHGFIEKYPKETKFHFIDDVVRQSYADQKK